MNFNINNMIDSDMINMIERRLLQNQLQIAEAKKEIIDNFIYGHSEDRNKDKVLIEAEISNLTNHLGKLNKQVNKLMQIVENQRRIIAEQEADINQLYALVEINHPR